eukprot:206971_1
MAPDGNGGIYPAMEKNGILTDLKERGVGHVHAFAIDNALVKPCDPHFVGYCIQEHADCGNKVLWKADAHEKVGVIAERITVVGDNVGDGAGDSNSKSNDKGKGKGKGKPCVVEYSELSQEMAERTTSASASSTSSSSSSSSSSSGKLAFGAANMQPLLQPAVSSRSGHSQLYQWKPAPCFS